MNNKLKEQILKEIEELEDEKERLILNIKNNWNKPNLKINIIRGINKLGNNNEVYLEILNKVEAELKGKVEDVEKMINGYSDNWVLYDGNDTKSLKELIKQIKKIFGEKK